MPSHVKPADALAAIRRAGRLGEIRYVDHAYDRMKERGISRADAKKALASAGRIWPADEPGRWRVEGYDLDRTALRLVVVVERGVVVVTAYRP